MISAYLLALAQSDPGVLLLINRNVPEGHQVAAAWRAWRELPDAREFLVDAPPEELITRAAYDFEIAAPLRAYLESEAGAGVLWIIPVYGVPLGIREQVGFDGSARNGTDRNEAAVDSELALLRRKPQDHSGWVESPLFDRDAPLALEDGVLGVIRLDGPSFAIALALPSKAVLAELFGSVGESFLDTRGLTDEEDGYGQRDVHMRSVRTAWERLRLPFAADDLPEVVDLTDRTLLHYQGWYAGDQRGWHGVPRFRTGAIAVHLHSFAAHTLRDPTANWVAPLLQSGATASCGTVFEPYTVGFPYEGVFWRRIADGWSFGEAAVASSQLLSWQAVFVGDPLWRPYAQETATACAERRAVFAAALRAWPVVPAPALFERVELAWRYFDEQLGRIRDSAAANDEATAIIALDRLLKLCDGWDFEAAIAEALAPSLGVMIEKGFKELERSLPRDPADPTALARFEQLARGVSAFGWQARAERLRLLLSEKQEDFVAKALAKKLPTARSGRLLDHWQELRRAEGCAYAARAAEAGPLRLALESDPERAEALREEADKALSRKLREAEQLLKRERFTEAGALLEALDEAHPECPTKLYLRTLLGQARKGRL